MLSQTIKSARTSRGYSQEEAAKMLGVSRPTYHAIESGKKDVTLRQAEIMSAMFSISIEELAYGDGETGAFADSVSVSEKYKQMILYLMQHGCDEDGRITKTKLAKMLYLADFSWYYEHLSPMSGVLYRKLPRGPVADIYFRLLDEFEEDGVVGRTERKNAIMYAMVEPGEAPSDKLSKGEIDLLRKIAKRWQHQLTSEIVDFTHRQLPWQICREGEIIPYGLITQEEPELIYG
jgi:DNA-binding XRE family transcriptional regulator/uncharacterized phage-associated protein